MKDTEKVELTAGSVRAAAESCGTAKEVLKKLFPEVFIGDREDVTDKAYIENCGNQLFLCVADDLGEDRYHQRSLIYLNPENTWRWHDGSTFVLEISKGKLWRRKS